MAKLSKLLTNREMELFNLVVNQAVAIDRLCPEVGMGPSRMMIAKEIAAKLSFKIDEDDIAEVCEKVSGS